MQSSGGRHNLMEWACKVAGKLYIYIYNRWKEAGREATHILLFAMLTLQNVLKPTSFKK